MSRFIIRRTNDLLPSTCPQVRACCVLQDVSVPARSVPLFIRSPEIKKLLRGTGSQPLKAIGILKKLCNHPDLLDLPSDLDGSEEYFPEGYTPRDRRHVNPELSGKMMCCSASSKRSALPPTTRLCSSPTTRRLSMSSTHVPGESMGHVPPGRYHDDQQTTKAGGPLQRP